MFIAGPSHVQVLANWHRRGHFKSINSSNSFRFKGFQSCPIYSQHLVDALKQARPHEDIVLFVTSSHRFNMMHSKMAASAVPFMVTKQAHAKVFRSNKFLYDRALLHDQSVVTCMDANLCRWLDRYVKLYPRIRFVFWCDFAQHHRNRIHGKTPSMHRMLYDDLYARYRDNTVDLHRFLAESGLTYEQSVKDDLLHMRLSCARKLLAFISSRESA